MNLKEHCKSTKKIYGVEGQDIHEWMDAPVKIIGPTHRKYRHTHDVELPLSILTKYPSKQLARDIVIQHLLDDKAFPDDDINYNNDCKVNNDCSDIYDLITKILKISKLYKYGDIYGDDRTPWLKNWGCLMSKCRWAALAAATIEFILAENYRGNPPTEPLVTLVESFFPHNRMDESIQGLATRTNEQ